MVETGQIQWYYPNGLGQPRKCVVIGPEVHPDGSKTGMFAVDFCRGSQRTATIVDVRYLYSYQHAAYEAMSDYYYDMREAEKYSQFDTREPENE
jgi:hypothetical protein